MKLTFNKFKCSCSNCTPILVALVSILVAVDWVSEKKELEVCNSKAALFLCLFRLILLVNPVIQALAVPCDLNSIELHPRYYINISQLTKFPQDIRTGFLFGPFAHLTDQIMLAQDHMEMLKTKFGPLTKDGAVLCVLVLGVGSQYGTEAIVVDLVLVRHHELAPPLLSLRALHLVLDNGLSRVEFGEVFAEVFVNVVIYLGQAQCAALDFLENGPVGLEVFDGWDDVVSETDGEVFGGMATYPLLQIASQSALRLSAKETPSGLDNESSSHLLKVIGIVALKVGRHLLSACHGGSDEILFISHGVVLFGKGQTAV